MSEPLTEVIIDGSGGASYTDADLYGPGGGDVGGVGGEPGGSPGPQPEEPPEDSPPDDGDVLAEVPIPGRRDEPPRPQLPIYTPSIFEVQMFGASRITKPAPRPKPAPKPRRTAPKPGRTRPTRPRSPPKPPVRYTPRPIPTAPGPAPGLFGRLLTTLLRTISLPVALLTYSRPAGPDDEYPGDSPMYPGMGPQRGESDDRPNQTRPNGAGSNVGNTGPNEGLGTVVIGGSYPRQSAAPGVSLGAALVTPYLDLVSAPVQENVPFPTVRDLDRRGTPGVSPQPSQANRRNPRPAPTSGLVPDPLGAPRTAPFPQLPLPRPRPSPTPRPTTPVLPIGPQPLPTPGPDPSKVKCTCRPIDNKPKKKRKKKPAAPEPIEMEFEVTSKTLGKVKVEGKVGKFCYQPNKLRKKICL